MFDTCDTSQTGWDGDNNLTGKVVKSSKSTCSPVHISQVVLVVHSSSRARVERGPTLYETHDKCIKGSGYQTQLLCHLTLMHVHFQSSEYFVASVILS